MTTTERSLIEASAPLDPPTLIVLEGNPGTGKSTIAKCVSSRLGAMVFHFPPSFVRFREEAELDTSVAPHPRLFYYLAATLHLGQLVTEALTAGNVICDRYAGSPIALLLAEGAVSPAEVERWWDPHEPEIPAPAATIFLHCKYPVARERIQRRAAASDGPINSVNARVIASPSFYATMAETLHDRVQRFGPVIEIDTTERAEAEICQEALTAIKVVAWRDRSARGSRSSIPPDASRL